MSTLQSAIKEFLSHCMFEKRLSPKTIKAYECDLIQVAKFLIDKKYSLEIDGITKYELREFLESISHLKPKSVRRKVATIKTMFNFLEYEDKIAVNPFRKMRVNIKEPRELPKVMDIKEINAIFKSVYRYPRKKTAHHSSAVGLRNIVVIELLFATGARVSEITNLKDDTINIKTGAVTIRGKGSKERIIQICNKETLNILGEYYRLFKKRIALSGGYFLVNRFGRKLSEQSVRNLVRLLATKAGIQKRITPHTFRHSFATLLLEKDVDIKYIQSLLGHSSIMTTQIYTHVNRKKQTRILRAKHPRRDFSMA